MFPDVTRDDVFRLETERLWLRWPCARDVFFIAQEAADPRIAAGDENIPHPYREGSAAEFVLTARKANYEGEQLILVIAPRERPDRVIGSIALAPLSASMATLRFWLGHGFWGQGFMTEATQNLLDLAFRLTPATEFRARAAKSNRAAQRVLVKSGFVAAQGGECFVLARHAWAEHYVRLGANAHNQVEARA